MIDLTVDAYILLVGSGLSDSGDQAECWQLMELIRTGEGVFLALDKRGTIEAEYRLKMGHGSLGQQWLKELATRGRVIAYALIPWNRGTRTALQEAHFDPDDYKYVRTAIVTEAKWIVAEEDDWSPQVCRILSKREGIQVARATETSQFVEGQIAE